MRIRIHEIHDSRFVITFLDMTLCSDTELTFFDTRVEYLVQYFFSREKHAAFTARHLAASTFRRGLFVGHKIGHLRFVFIAQVNVSLDVLFGFRGFALHIAKHPPEHNGVTHTSEHDFHGEFTFLHGIANEIGIRNGLNGCTQTAFVTHVDTHLP
jgi:hypothetical protein